MSRMTATRLADMIDGTVRLIRRFRGDTSGATGLEYALIVVSISFSIIAGTQAVGDRLSNLLAAVEVSIADSTASGAQAKNQKQTKAEKQAAKKAKKQAKAAARKKAQAEKKAKKKAKAAAKKKAKAAKKAAQAAKKKAKAAAKKKAKK